MTRTTQLRCTFNAALCICFLLRSSLSCSWQSLPCFYCSIPSGAWGWGIDLSDRHLPVKLIGYSLFHFKKLPVPSLSEPLMWRTACPDSTAGHLAAGEPHTISIARLLHCATSHLAAPAFCCRRLQTDRNVSYNKPSYSHLVF